MTTYIYPNKYKLNFDLNWFTINDKSGNNPCQTDRADHLMYHVSNYKHLLFYSDYQNDTSVNKRADIRLDTDSISDKWKTAVTFDLSFLNVSE